MGTTKVALGQLAALVALLSLVTILNCCTSVSSAPLISESERPVGVSLLMRDKFVGEKRQQYSHGTLARLRRYRAEVSARAMRSPDYHSVRANSNRKRLANKAARRRSLSPKFSKRSHEKSDNKNDDNDDDDSRLLKSRNLKSSKRSQQLERGNKHRVRGSSRRSGGQRLRNAAYRRPIRKIRRRYERANPLERKKRRLEAPMKRALSKSRSFESPEELIHDLARKLHEAIAALSFKSEPTERVKGAIEAMDGQLAKDFEKENKRFREMSAAQHRVVKNEQNFEQHSNRVEHFEDKQEAVIKRQLANIDESAHPNDSKHTHDNNDAPSSFSPNSHINEANYTEVVDPQHKARSSLHDRLNQVRDLLYFEPRLMDQIKGTSDELLSPLESAFKRLVLCNSDEQFCRLPKRENVALEETKVGSVTPTTTSLGENKDKNVAAKPLKFEFEDKKDEQFEFENADDKWESVSAAPIITEQKQAHHGWKLTPLVPIKNGGQMSNHSSSNHRHSSFSYSKHNGQEPESRSIIHKEEQVDGQAPVVSHYDSGSANK